MPSETPVVLELDDIQSGALHGRPSPYVGVHILLRIDDRRAGREFLRGVIPALAPAANPADPDPQAWVTAALTFQGLKALGVPQDSLDSFPPEVPAGHGRACGRAGRCRGERSRTLGTAVWDPGHPRRGQRAFAGCGTARGSYSRALEKRTKICQASASSGASTAMCCPPKRKPSGLRTA